MDNSELLDMNRWLSALVADVIFTHLTGIARAPTGREQQRDERRSQPTTPQTALLTDSWSRVELFIDTLSEPQQQVLRLHLTEGLSYRELADRLAIPVGTVHSRVARAKQRIRAAVAQQSVSAAASHPPGAEPAADAPTPSAVRTLVPHQSI